MFSGSAVTGAQSTSFDHLTGSDKVLSLALIVGFILLAGAVVILGRRLLEGPPQPAGPSATAGATSSGPGESNTDSTLIRSWLAVSLVGGLLIFVAVSFWLDDTTLRSTLIGGVVATPLRLEVHPATPGISAQVVTQAPPANQSAPAGWTVVATFAGPVPELRGQSPDGARSLLEAVGLQLDPVPAQPTSTAQATDQDPKPDAAPTGFKVRVTFN